MGAATLNLGPDVEKLKALSPGENGGALTLIFAGVTCEGCFAGGELNIFVPERSVLAWNVEGWKPTGTKLAVWKLLGSKVLAVGWKLLAPGLNVLAPGWKLLAPGWKLPTPGWKVLAVGSKVLTAGSKLLAPG